MANIRRLFAGTNSAGGFVSFFAHITNQGTKNVYLLKGGPGTGKSRFMQDLAETPELKDTAQERFYCSSDPFSLDAVHLPQLGTALIDATAPHAIDAEWPGCRDHLIPLGNFWSKAGLIERRDEIVAAGRDKKSHFAAAFRYFAAAKLIEENIIARNPVDPGAVSAAVKKLAPLLNRSDWNGEKGRVRRLFASALTPEGYVSFVEGLAAECDERYILTGGIGHTAAACLGELASLAELTGLDAEIFHYPLNPDRIQHIIFPQLKVGIFSETILEKLEKIGGTAIACAPADSAEDGVAGDQTLFRELVERGIASLKRAETSHGAVEKYYAEQMDFSLVAQERNRVLGEILHL
ncbi:MAG: hypothetical protein GX101_05535 [Firmicutes bacterium]|jgi:hypothetical protein|nr:hypothetical protein [Bacillota bacterium]NLO66136.1 hypothetical protein [Bacillota bacterium]